MKPGELDFRAEPQPLRRIEQAIARKNAAVYGEHGRLLDETSFCLACSAHHPVMRALGLKLLVCPAAPPGVILAMDSSRVRWIRTSYP